MLFHNVQKSFIAQTGDPTGTGKGGSSVYGCACLRSVTALTPPVPYNALHVNSSARTGKMEDATSHVTHTIFTPSACETLVSCCQDM